MVKPRNNVGEKKKVGLRCCFCVRRRERGYECERESVSIRENKLCCINRGLEEKEITVCEGVAAQCPCCEKNPCCVVQVRRS